MNSTGAKSPLEANLAYSWVLNQSSLSGSPLFLNRCMPIAISRKEVNEMAICSKSKNAMNDVLDE
jgi:hypothetical protein